MVPPPFPHKQYLRFVSNKAAGCGGLPTSHRHFDVWRKLKATNLDSAYSILAGLYSSDWGSAGPRTSIAPCARSRTAARSRWPSNGSTTTSSATRAR